jgi:hypothetical protein
VRFFRREDGTMLTRDCPVGLRAVRIKVARLWASTVAMFGAVTLSSFWGRVANGEEVADPKPKIDIHLLKEIKGDVCLTPSTLPLNKLGAVELVQLLKMARERDAKVTGGMPDPLDPEVILESERQSLETRIGAKGWICPLPGTKEYEALMKQLTSVLKQHADLLQAIQPAPVMHAAVQGRIAAPVHKIELPE